MRRLRRLIVRLAALFSGARLEREMTAELEADLRLHIDDLRAAGVPPAEARRRALVRLGGLESLKEHYRDAQRVPALDTMVQDLRYGVRALRRCPAFTLTAVMTLALTIAAISTVATVAHTLVFRQLPVSQPEGLVEVQPTRRNGTELGLASYPDYAHFREATRTLQDLAAHYSTAPLFVTARGNASEINGAVVSANFLPLLGVEPTLGRFFSADEDRVPGRDPVLVLSDALWRRWFDASPDVLGATVGVNGVPFTVIGVAPPNFRGVRVQPVELYLPTMMLGVGYRWCADSLAADCTILSMMGRLADNQDRAAAAAELATLLPPWWRRAAPGDNTGVRVITPRGAGGANAEADVLTLLALAAFALLVVCCANLAGLLAARGATRTRELAIRTSLGASRGRLVRQLLTESIMLAMTGGVIGLALSVWMADFINVRFFAADGAGRPLYFDFGLQPFVVLVVVALTVLAGLTFGVVPAMGSVRHGSAEALRHRSGAQSRARLERWLLGAQVALGVALVSVATLLAASAGAIARGKGYDPSQVALLRVRPRLVGYSPARAQRFLRSVVGQLESLPGVTSLSLVGTGAALTGAEGDVSLPEPGAQPFRVGYIEIGPRYFETLRTPLLQGREFVDDDAAGAPPVAIVSAALARRLWPDRSALGSRLMVGGDARTVVGVAQDVELQANADAIRPYVYVPFWQRPPLVDARLQIRVAGDPAAMLPTLTATVHQVDPSVPIADTTTLRMRLAGRFRSLRMGALFVSYAGVLAVLLSAIGLYGAFAFAVSRRTQEIGVRMAVGSSPGGIVSLIAREGLTVTLTGVAIGLGLTLVAVRLLQPTLHGQASEAPLTYAATALLVTCVCVAACWLPARRAARVAPTAALRQE